MNPVMYNELVTKTFRDEAIRSVMMIDDDFVPYDEMCHSDFVFSGLTLNKQLGTRKAANIHKFFHGKKIVCDVDKGDDHIDVERIRKSDLVILDYHLENEDPTKCLKLLHELSSTEHMNLVVVYTRESLDTVWMTIAACLRGAVSTDALLEKDPSTSQVWDEKTFAGSDVPAAWADVISNEDLVTYLKTGSATQATTAWFGKVAKVPAKSISKIMCERAISERNLIRTAKSEAQFLGESGEKKWLQVGNVFIVLHGKTKNDNPEEPAGIWAAIEAALVDWKPSYYQLLISEMQNRLENETVSFANTLAHDAEGQAAWLYEILTKRLDGQHAPVISQLFDRLTDELRMKLIENERLRSAFAATFESLVTETTSDMDRLNYAVAHVKLSSTKSVKEDVGHALNYALCSRDFDGGYVTSGTVMYDRDDPSKWYLCVAPACETVPLQATGQLAKRLKPHRMMKVLVLENVNMEEALNNATGSNHIFVKGPSRQRKALSVLNRASHQPMVDYALIKNHDASSAAVLKAGIVVSFLHLDKDANFDPLERTLIPASQLRDMYTARYQTLASHHTGRVGVDFVNFMQPKSKNDKED